ncbi:MAG: hypothetical protein SXU28_14500 [Pseudomonadota bacterium]|nr:hypothetical protein [Pseudomonadota bacterium]
MKFAKLALLATTLVAAPYAASAQDAGTTIFSQVDGTEVGNVESNDGATVVVNTGTHKAPLPTSYFAEREGQWTINATKAQIDSLMAAQKAEADAKLDAALVDGAAVVSADNIAAGTVLAIDTAADQVIVEREGGIVSLKREHFAVNAEGKLTALYTLEQIGTFTTEVPEGAEIRTASGTLIRNADGSEPAAEETASASAAGTASTGASE